MSNLSQLSHHNRIVVAQNANRYMPQYEPLEPTNAVIPVMLFASFAFWFFLAASVLFFLG